MSDLKQRYRAASSQCMDNVFFEARRSPAEVLRRLADACDELELGWDMYGAGGAVARLEEELTGLFGTEAAAFFPSGTMAQQAALRVWCERAGTRRIAMPDIAHPLVHELDGPRLLHGFEISHLTVGHEVPTAAALESLPERLAAVLVELPLRDAGCILPTWQQLVDLSRAARERGVALHVDGARIWESQPFYDRPLSEIAALADSMYVSFYKGLNGVSGAALVGSADFLAEARQWRSRMGGTLFHSTPEAVSALVGLREMLPHIPECLRWARRLAVELPGVGITVNPRAPHTPVFQLYAAGDVDAVNDRLIEFIEREKIRLCGPWWSADEPGRVMTEVMVSRPALAHDPLEVAGWLAGVVNGPGDVPLP